MSPVMANVDARPRCKCHDEPMIKNGAVWRCRISHKDACARQYQAYLALCRQHGVKPQTKSKWHTHYADLRARERKQEKPTLIDYRAWWLTEARNERGVPFTMAELKQLAGGMM